MLKRKPKTLRRLVADARANIKKCEGRSALGGTDDAAHMTHDRAHCKQHATGDACDRRWMHRACLLSHASSVSCPVACMHPACHVPCHPACLSHNTRCYTATIPQWRLTYVCVVCVCGRVGVDNGDLMERIRQVLQANAATIARRPCPAPAPAPAKGSAGVSRAGAAAGPLPQRSVSTRLQCPARTLQDSRALDSRRTYSNGARRL